MPGRFSLATLCIAESRAPSLAVAVRRIPGQQGASDKVTKEELAEALRSKLEEKCARGELDASLPAGREPFLETLRQATHDKLITGYLKCSVCGQMTMPLERAMKLAAHLDTPEDWLKALALWRTRFSPCRH